MTNPFGPILGGFECGIVPADDGSEHFLLHTTRHTAAQNMSLNYRTALSHGITTVRDGLAGGDDAYARLRIARDTGMKVIWDIIHFQQTDHLQAYELGKEAAKAHMEVNGYAPFWICPLNEIETHAWTRKIGMGRAIELWAAALEGILSVMDTRCVKVVGSCVLNHLDDDWRGIDAIAPHCDVVGINLYEHHMKDSPLNLLRAVYQRTNRPVMITETSHHIGHPEHSGDKVSWAAYIESEVQAAQAEGIPVWGWCWYPLVNCTRWDKTADDEWDHGLIKLDGSIDESLSRFLKDRM